MGSIFKLFLVGIFLTGCTSLIYYPDKYMHGHPDHFDTKFDAFFIDSLDKTKLSMWKLHSKKEAKNLVAYFHGNAENITSHFANLVWMSEFNSDVFIFDYRGYGLSEGEPSPKGLSEDGLAFLNYAYNEYKNGKYEKFIIYTQSLGGSVALKSLEDFEDRGDVSLLVLDSTFRSPQEVARDKTFWPLSLIIPDSYTASPKLSHITMPVLSIHSKKDPVINYKLGEKLYLDLKDAKSKKMWTLEEEGHGNVFFLEKYAYRKTFIDFINSL